MPRKLISLGIKFSNQSSDRPEERETQISEAIRHYNVYKRDYTRNINRYIASCESAMMCNIDVRISNYLKLIPRFLPIRTIVVGESPYSENLLPGLASSFAFNPRYVTTAPPSAQVLSQFISMVTGVPLWVSMPMVSCSYMMIEDGIVFLNCEPASDVNDGVRMKLRSLFCEMVIDMCNTVRKFGVDEIYVLEVGEVSRYCMNMVSSSIKDSSEGGTKLTRSRISHPAWLARTFGVETEQPDRLIDDSVLEICLSVELSMEAPLYINSSDRRVTSIPWFQYSLEELSLLGSQSSILHRLVSTWNNRINSVVGLSLGSINKEIMSSKKPMQRKMDYKKGKDSENSNRDKGNGSDKSYVMSVIDTVRTTCLDQASIANKIARDVAKLADDYEESETKVEIYELLDGYRKCLSALETSAALYISIAGTLTSNKTAISLGGQNLGPIVGVVSVDSDGNRSKMDNPTMTVQEVIESNSGGTSKIAYNKRHDTEDESDRDGDGSYSVVPSMDADSERFAFNDESDGEVYDVNSNNDASSIGDNGFNLPMVTNNKAIAPKSDSSKTPIKTEEVKTERDVGTRNNNERQSVVVSPNPSPSVTSSSNMSRAAAIAARLRNKNK